MGPFVKQMINTDFENRFDSAESLHGATTDLKEP